MRENCYDLVSENDWQKVWEEDGICRFDTFGPYSPIFSVDAPPTYASGALYKGHVVVYSQKYFAPQKCIRGCDVMFHLYFGTNRSRIEVKKKRICQTPWPHVKETMDEKPRSTIQNIIAAVNNRKSGLGLPLNFLQEWLRILPPLDTEDIDNRDAVKTLKIKELEDVDKYNLSDKILGAKPNKARIGSEFKTMPGEVIKYISVSLLEEFMKMQKKFEIVELSRIKVDMEPGHFKSETSLSYKGEGVEIIHVAEAAMMLRSAHGEKGPRGVNI